MNHEVHSQGLQLLIELRQRLIICLLMFAIVFFPLFYFSNYLYTYLALPLLKNLPPNHGLIAINITAPFFAPMELSFFVAGMLVVPFVLYQLWNFIAPALYRREKKLLWPLLFISTVLFYCGVIFAYAVILPIIFRFMTHAAPQGVSVSPDITQYLDFTLKLFFVFGVIFEIPVITILLVWSGVVTREKLIKCRPYVIVGAFIVAMLLGPPDVISQTLLALPMCILFEVGIALSRFWR